MAGYRELLENLVLPAFGDLPINRISRAAVRSWLATMQANGLSTSRMRQARGVLHRILATAVHDGAILRNAVDGTTVGRVPTRRARYLTADQVAKLARAAEKRQKGAGLTVETLAWVGLRWRELVALRTTRVDSKRLRIEVTEAKRLAERLRRVDPDRQVFAAPSGGLLRSNFRTRIWAPAVAAAGLDPDLRPHDLRHTAATLMIGTGASIKTVQRQLGYASATMTLDRYGHLYKDEFDTLALALEQRHAHSVAAQVRHKPPRQPEKSLRDNASANRSRRSEKPEVGGSIPPLTTQPQQAPTPKSSTPESSDPLITPTSTRSSSGASHEMWVGTTRRATYRTDRSIQ